MTRRSAIKARLLSVLTVAAVSLSGCSSLLDRSYSVVEPYTDRYWDSTAEDTLKAENYQDLVNSLLMLIQQGSEEGVIRYYAPEGEDGYLHAVSAKQEVRTETIPGSYLLDALSLNCTEGENYYTLTYRMFYRKNTQDMASIMAISDSQSLVDLLRISVREELPSLTAQFISKTSREEVRAAVETLWQELCLDQLAMLPTPDEETQDGVPEPSSEGTVGETSGEPDTEQSVKETTDETDTENPPEGTDSPSPPIEQTVPTSAEQTTPPEQSETPEQPPTEPDIVFPTCPWIIRFYPNSTSAEIVEILLIR